MKIKKLLVEEFDMVDLGELRSFLGMLIDQGNHSLSVSQYSYLEQILTTFNMQDCKSCDTPAMPVNVCESPALAVDIPYRQAVGSLIYLATCTRPDISYAVSIVSRKMHTPTEQDWIAVKRILRYLQGTKHAKLRYTADSSEYSTLTSTFIGYSDASYAPDAIDRKSVSGYVFLMNGAAISWKSKKQPIISLSSMEAEYIALTSAAKEGLWFRKFQCDLGLPASVLTIFEDNQSTILTAKNDIHNERSKHIDVRYHWIREQISLEKLIVTYCPTQEMIADIFTKPLGKILFQKFCDMLGLEFKSPSN